MFHRFIKNSVFIAKFYKNLPLQTITRNMTSTESKNFTLSQVLIHLESFAPLKLAEPWDNVGVLIEPVENRNETIIKTILLTIDLTERVVQEAVDTKAELIITYHPLIFKPIKCITQKSWKDRITIKCIQNNINVFSPHTTWDCIDNGVNDWLASIFPLINKTQAIVPSQFNNGNANVGMGRLINLVQPIPLGELIALIKQHIGINHLRVGVAKNGNLEISSIAICAGSGASILNGIKADLYLTGEMLHHDVLEATANGIHVILCNHSDSERGYLKVFKETFASRVPGIDILISKYDKDCLTTI